MNNLFSLWKYIDYSRRKITAEDLSLPVIELGPNNVINFLSQEISREQLLHKYLLVEGGDFICNYGDLEALKNGQASIFLYQEKSPSLISKKNYVFRANTKLANEDFLYLVFTNPSFLSKLSAFAFKCQQAEKSLSREVFWEKFKDLGVNFPDLLVQERIVRNLKVISTLLGIKTNINKELERWMELQFQLLGKDGESLETKSFQELFEIVKGIEKFSEKQKRCNYKTVKSKFISAGMCDPTKEGCEFCNYQLCKADKLLLSKRVYEGEDQKYLLKLWVGCDGSASIDSFISIFPKKEMGIPYSYYLLKTHLDKLITSISGATTTRSLNTNELKVFNFQLHPLEKIIEFNRTCESIFEHQKILEEEINKLSNLLERKKKMLDLKMFEEKWDW